MDEFLKNHFIEQLDRIIKEGNVLKSNSSHSDLSDKDSSKLSKVISDSHSSVVRITGNNSTYTTEFVSIFESKHSLGYKMKRILGIVESLKENISLGYLRDISEIIHGELFGDFLEMASHLLDDSYKDAAAVIAGSTLEEHLRQLCIKNNIPIEISTGAITKSKKAESMNSDLANSDIYNKLDQKSVTA